MQQGIVAIYIYVMFGERWMGHARRVRHKPPSDDGDVMMRVVGAHYANWGTPHAD